MGLGDTLSLLAGAAVTEVVTFLPGIRGMLDLMNPVSFASSDTTGFISIRAGCL